MPKNRNKPDLPAAQNSAGKRKLRTLLIVAVNFILLFALYQLMLRLQWIAGTYLYLAAAAALTVAYYIVNRGFGRPVTDADAMPSSWSAKEKCDYAAFVQKRHESAKKILYWLFPILLTLLLDCIDVFLLDSLRGILTACASGGAAVL